MKSSVGSTQNTDIITYDPKYVGNPLSIGTKQLTWEGRRLKQIMDGTNTFTYSYNEQGLRTKKNIHGVETKYYLQGSNIIAEEKNGQTMHFIYNEQNQLVGFEYQQNKYFYVRDLLGIIRNIIDVNGNIVVTYKYDAWGNHKVYDSSNAENTSSSFIGNINPFRYKGYYYDVETEWYYLQSRYYSPFFSRFVSMDHTQYLEPGNTNGVNLFGYCASNPVMYADPSGKFAITSFLIGMGIAALIGMGVGAVSYTASEVISYGLTGEWSWSWGAFAGSTIGGGITGALAFAFPGLGIMGSAGINGFLSNSLGMVFQNSLGEANHSLTDVLWTSVGIGFLSVLTAGITSKIKIPGFTGRGSISQVARQISTKFYNGTIGRITSRTFGKMVAYELAYTVFDTVIGGIWDAFETNSREAWRRLIPRVTVPVLN